MGNLDRYVELTGTVVQRYGRERGYGLASYVDGLQSSGRVSEAVALAEESVAAARELGNPYWISYALWIAGLAFSKADAQRALAAWDEGVAFVREHRVQFFEGFLARDAARLHTSAGEPEAALVLFSEAITAFHRAGNVPQLVITLASLPTLFEHLDRPEPRRRCSLPYPASPRALTTSRNPATWAADSPAASARSGRKSSRSPERCSISTIPPCTRSGRSTSPVGSPIPRQERPGGLSRREIEVLRLVADGRTAREIAAQLFISSRTAEHHIQHVYTKIGVSGRAAATRWAVKHNVVDAAGR